MHIKSKVVLSILLSVLLAAAEVSAAHNAVYEYHSFLGSTSTDLGQDVAVDSDGNIYVVGYSAASWNFPPGATISIMPKNAHSGGNDIMVVKYDSSGTYQWHSFYGSAGDDYGASLAIDETGNIYIVGSSDQGWFGYGLISPFPITPKNNHAGGHDIVVIKLDSNGNYHWHTFFGSSSMDSGSAIAMDSIGNLFLSGSSYESWSGPGPVSPLNPYADSIDVVVVKLNSSGVYQWHTFYGSSDVDGGHSIRVDSNDRVVVTGESYASWNGSGGEPPVNALTSFHDLLLLKIDAAGNYQWHTFHGSPASDFATGIAIDTSDNIYLTGRSNQSWNGPGATPPLHEYSGSWDIFTAGFNSSGTYLWHTFYGSTGFEQTSEITVDGSGNLFMTGESLASWDGPGGIAPEYAHSNNSSGDLYLLQLKTSGAYVSHAFLGSTTGMDFGMGLTTVENGVLYLAGKSDESWLGPEGENPRYKFTDSTSDILLIKFTYGSFPWTMMLPAIIGDGQQ